MIKPIFVVIMIIIVLVVVVTVITTTPVVMIKIDIVGTRLLVVSVAIMIVCRDDVHHHGRRIDWGSWAVCRDDWHFSGTGALKTGASYHPAPGEQLFICWNVAVKNCEAMGCYLMHL